MGSSLDTMHIFSDRLIRYAETSFLSTWLDLFAILNESTALNHLPNNIASDYLTIDEVTPSMLEIMLSAEQRLLPTDILLHGLLTSLKERGNSGGENGRLVAQAATLVSDGLTGRHKIQS